MREYKTIDRIAGPLVFVEKTEPIAYGELASIQLRNSLSTHYSFNYKEKKFKKNVNIMLVKIFRD